jgi:hypothetical protein
MLRSTSIPVLSIGESLADDSADTPDVQIHDLEVE